LKRISEYCFTQIELGVNKVVLVKRDVKWNKKYTKGISLDAWKNRQVVGKKQIKREDPKIKEHGRDLKEKEIIKVRKH
jgi:hypothetical protein